MVRFVSKINAKADDVYTWHQNFGANERLTPPWMTSRLLRQEYNENETLQYIKTDQGLQIEKTISNPAKRSIISEKTISSQQSFQHVKDFDNIDDKKTLIKETVSFNWFSSILPTSIVNSLIEKRLEKEFHFRGKRIENDIKQHARFSGAARQNIAILGQDNIIAQQFKPFFTSGKHTVYSFVQRKPYPTAREIQLNTTNANIGLTALKAIDNVIYFPLSDKTKLTEQNFDSFLESKVQELRFLIAGFKQNKKYPSSFVMMSSTCVYKDSKNSVNEYSATEASSKIATLYLKLEKELEKLAEAGCRVVYARTGNILTAKTGVLKRAISKQKFGFCGQNLEYSKKINWISLDDAIYATNQILFDNKLSGVINLCSSMTLEANDLHPLLSQKTQRPLLFNLPKFVFDLAYGTIKNEQILQSKSIFPQRLKQSGFEFSFENIDDALNWETGHFRTNDPFANY